MLSISSDVIEIHVINMKTRLTLLFILVTFFTNGQNRAQFHHKIKRSYIESGYLDLVYKDKNMNKKNVTLCSEERPGIITLVNGVPVIDFWQIKDSLNVQIDTCLSKNTDLGRFEIDLSRNKVGEPTRYIVIPFRAWSWGVGTNPFRYRPKTNGTFSSVSTSLGVSLNYGKTYGFSKISPRAINNYSITIGPFIGLSSVELKKSTVKSPNTWETDRTNVAFSYGLNAILARNNFGLVFSIGFDNSFGENSKEWSHQNMPWFGIGINTSLGIF
jgi:hypothetical protein